MGRQLISLTLCLAAATTVLGQTAPRADKHSPEPRLLSKAEGHRIVSATSFANGDLDSEADCSHLVHSLYEQAGFPYDYAPSRDLYLGNPHFARVRSPQPGDLIVWRGHVGIVIDPKRHSFFSSVSSGPDTQFYDSTYWRSRGTPRFYRYLAEEPAHFETASRGVAGRDSSGVAQPAAIRVWPLRIRGKKPEPEEVAAAFAEMSQGSDDFLRLANLRNPSEPVIVYSQLRVTSLEVKGKRGAARVRVECLVSLPPSQAASQAHWAELSLELQKMKTGWTLRNLQDEALYVPREAALRALSSRLAALTQSADASLQQKREQTEIIRFLNLLVPDDYTAVSAEESTNPRE